MEIKIMKHMSYENILVRIHACFKIPECRYILVKIQVYCKAKALSMNVGQRKIRPKLNSIPLLIVGMKIKSVVAKTV